MTLRDFGGLARRLWWIFVVCILGGVVIAAGVVLLSSRVYTSSSRLLVATPNIDQSAQVPPGGITIAQRAINYANLVTGTTIPLQVIDQLGLTKSLPDLLDQTSVRVLTGTTIIEISVTDPSADQAQRIAKAFTDDLIVYVPKVESQSGTPDSTVSLTVTDQADLPATPDPRHLGTTAALGGVLGLVLAVAIVRILGLRDTTIRRVDTLELNAGPLLGTIHDDPGTPDQITGSNTSSKRAEEYRAIRTRLRFVDVDSATPIFTVTGADASAGATKTATNLAISTAQTGQRVLLLEANLHHPTVSQLLGLPGGHAGLGDFLTGTAELPHVVQHVDALRLDVITAGTVPPDPTERVQSKDMDTLLTKLRGQYDVVLIDTPSLIAASDAVLLAAATDGVILVAAFGATTDPDLRASVARLAAVRARLIGSLLTFAPEDRKGKPRSSAEPAALVNGGSSPTSSA